MAYLIVEKLGLTEKFSVDIVLPDGEPDVARLLVDHPPAKTLPTMVTPDAEGKALLSRVADKFGLSAPGYHRVSRVARTIADLDGSVEVRKPHVAEAVGYRSALSKDV